MRGLKTSKVPMQDALLFISYSMPKHNISNVALTVNIKYQFEEFSLD